MIRGTTPTHIFTIPLDTSLLKEVVITYAQRDKPVVEKRMADCELNGKEIKVTLSQEDTLKFEERANGVRLQIRALTRDGVALASPIKPVSLREILNEEVLV